MVRRKVMRKLKVAITGGIGTGKSTVSKILKDAGYFVVSCDEITASLYETFAVKRQLKRLFPTAVTGKIRLTVDKKAIASEVFSSPEKRKALEDFLHPLIMEKVHKNLEKADGKMVFAEVPLLFEGGHETQFDKVIILTRPVSQRVESVMARSNLTVEEVLQRIDNQVDYGKIDMSKYTHVFNGGDKKELENEILTEIAKW